nr:hypothetical protein [Desulfobulbaceae bacterium]
MVTKGKCTVFTSGLRGAEAAFGEEAVKRGMQECVYTFADQKVDRVNAQCVNVLAADELARGNISMEIVSQMMNRKYYGSEKIRKVLQVLFHVVNSGHQVIVVGKILEDNTVKGGTGWTVELAKLFNRPLSVFDQTRDKWFVWDSGTWIEGIPQIKFDTLACSGTRNLTENGRKAIADLFDSAFGS